MPGLLDPLLVAKLATMELRARRVVEGALSGRHRSLHQGPSLEFAGHRPYSPSDEWRRVDWKVFARTDRWMVREQRQETNLRAFFLLDVSGSMAFQASGRLSKLRYASILLASLGYLLARRGESVGLCLYADGVKETFPCRGGAPHLSGLLERLESLSGGGTTDLARSLEDAAPLMPRRGMAVLVSDFLSAPAAAAAAVRTLLARKHEVLAVQVLDPSETDLPQEGDVLFEDMESGRAVRAFSEDLRESYRSLMRERLAGTERAFSSLGVRYGRFLTTEPLDRALAVFLRRKDGPSS